MNNNFGNLKKKNFTYEQTKLVLLGIRRKWGEEKMSANIVCA